ncbi:MAG TPA: hypothetical protein ENN68_05505 [Methanomicrobia archaeon]|nr:hypothetical protein [Methanomicrobia archaeon]
MGLKEEAKKVGSKLKEDVEDVSAEAIPQKVAEKKRRRHEDGKREGKQVVNLRAFAGSSLRTLRPSQLSGGSNACWKSNSVPVIPFIEATVSCYSGTGTTQQHT